MNSEFKTRSCVSKTRNCVSKTRNFAFKMMDFDRCASDPGPPCGEFCILNDVFCIKTRKYVFQKRGIVHQIWRILQASTRTTQTISRRDRWNKWWILYSKRGILYHKCWTFAGLLGSENFHRIFQSRLNSFWFLLCFFPQFFQNILTENFLCTYAQAIQAMQKAGMRVRQIAIKMSKDCEFFCLENAERMENFPRKLMIYRWKLGVSFAIWGNSLHQWPAVWYSHC